MRYQAALHSDLGAASVSNETNAGQGCISSPPPSRKRDGLALADRFSEAVAELGEFGGDAADLAELAVVHGGAEQRQILRRDA